MVDKVVFNAEFERRLKKLYKYLGDYFDNGEIGSIPSALFSCFTYLYCNSKYYKIVKK